MALLALTQGCGVEPDGLYALKLSRPPVEEDWQKALAFQLTASGGSTSKKGEADVDKDSVHKATASCHHGSGAPPVKAQAKAFYTGEKIYLRFTWADPTPDAGPSWERVSGRWTGKGGKRDGLGILWGGKTASFSCMSSCHLKDWRQAGDKAFGDFRMASAKGGGHDFWVWRPGRGEPLGAVEDAYLGEEGKKSDAEGPFEEVNSVYALKREPLPPHANPFGEGDSPSFPPADQHRSAMPGYRVAAAAPGALEVSGSAQYRDGQWTLTLERGLKGLDPGDVSFAPGGEYLFGLALMDGVVQDHNAAARPIKLKLLETTDQGSVEK